MKTIEPLTPISQKKRRCSKAAFVRRFGVCATALSAIAKLLIVQPCMARLLSRGSVIARENTILA
jgi:hypothetical protein